MLSMISFSKALSIVRASVPPLAHERTELHSLVGRVLAEDLEARVDLPGTDVSLKDGFAVCSADLSFASSDAVVTLKITGQTNAGSVDPPEVRRGTAVRITTGAMIPKGADAVVAEEFCKKNGDTVACFGDAHRGRNVLPKGVDIEKGRTILKSGRRLLPADVGLIAAAGMSCAEVFRVPNALVLSTGDEVVAPGLPLARGKLFASNLVEISSWLSLLGVKAKTMVVPDDPASIKSAIMDSLEFSDVLITTGGAWTSERDLIIGVLNELAWDARFHRVRLGPGKGVGFGLLENRPVFCLPGGPPSNEMALLQLALPGVMQMQAIQQALFPLLECVLLETVTGQADWTQVIPAKFENIEEVGTQKHLYRKDGVRLGVRPYRTRSRLQSMADKQALIMIPDGVGQISAGELVQVQSVRSMSIL